MIELPKGYAPRGIELPDPEGPATLSGQTLAKLAEAIETDLKDVVASLALAKLRLGQLEDEVPGINGLASACKGWRTQLDGMMADVDAKAASVRKKLMGSQPSMADGIVQTINPELAGQALLERASAKGLTES